MTPLLLAPLGLAALAALIVPLLIHLRRRTEELPLDFAAMRWLEALPRPRRRLRFDEWLLLALRLALITLLALLLAQPALLGWEDDNPRFIVAPGVAPEVAREIAGRDAEIRWIVPGFPEIGTAAPAGPAPTSSLIRQFDAELPQGVALTILVPTVLEGVDAERLRLSRPVNWRIIESDAATKRTATPPSPTLALRYAEGQTAPLRYFRAAAEAWSDSPGFEAQTEAALPPRGSVLVWLVPGPLPQPVSNWVREGGTALLASTADVAMPAATGPLWTDAAGRTLVEGAPLGHGRLMRFTRPLVPAQIPELLAPEFAASLRDLVAPPASPPARVSAAAFIPEQSDAPYKLPPRELAPWLGVLIALIFFAERWLATRQRRFSA